MTDLYSFTPWKVLRCLLRIKSPKIFKTKGAKKKNTETKNKKESSPLFYKFSLRLFISFLRFSFSAWMNSNKKFYSKCLCNWAREGECGKKARPDTGCNQWYAIFVLAFSSVNFFKKENNFFSIAIYMPQ